MPIQRAVGIPTRPPIKKQSMGMLPRFSIFKAKRPKSGDPMQSVVPHDSWGIEHNNGFPSLNDPVGVTVQEPGIDSVIHEEIATGSHIDERLPQMSSEEITDQHASHELDRSVEVCGPMDVNASTSTLSTEHSFSIPSPKRQSTQDSIATSMSSQSAQCIANVPPPSPQGSDPIMTPLLQIPLLSPHTTASETSGSENGVQSEPGPSSAPQVYDWSDTDIDLPPRYSFVAGPRRPPPSRSYASDESHAEDEISINEVLLSSHQGDRADQPNLVRLGKQPATGITSGITGFFSPWFLGERGAPSAEPESSTSAGVSRQWPKFWAQTTEDSRGQYSSAGTSSSLESYSLQDVDEYFPGDQDIENNKLLLETLQRLEEEDRLLAEELQRIEETDFYLAREWQDEEDEQLLLAEERQEHFRLEELIRIASEDALLAAELARQEQEEYEQAQQFEREETARLEEVERHERERQRQEEVRLLRETRRLGVPIAVRRIGHFGGFGEGNLDEVTPEIVDHLKSVKTLFLKHLPHHQITKIEWIINPKLQEQFEDTRQKLRNAGRSTKEIILFHGTAPANVDW